MRRLIGATFGAVLLAGSGVAHADEATGTIHSIDAITRTITLDSGQTFKLDPAVTLARLRMGTPVTITYEQKHGLNIAIKVVPARAENGGSAVNPAAGAGGK